MKTLGAKKLIITIGVLLSTLIFSCLGLMFSNMLSKRSGFPLQNNNVEAAGCGCSDPDTHYCFNASNSHEYLKDWYDYNQNYRIMNKAGLTSFATAVANGYDFAGKNVFLADDINCGGWSTYAIGINESELTYTAFAGTFEGDGHSIYNFTINDISVQEAGSHVQSTLPCGFFSVLKKGAVVCNLALKDYTINSRCEHSSATISPLTIIGGIAGSTPFDLGSGDSPSIYNCLVDGLTINCYRSSYRSENVLFIGGILGDDTALGVKTLSNCLVNRINFNVSTPDNYASVKVCGVLGNTNSTKVVNCVVNKKNLVSTISTGGRCEFYDISAYTTTNCHSTEGSTSGLNVSSEPGESGWLWYYHAECNKNYPCIRMFMSWTIIKVKSADETMGTVSGSSIYVPTELMSDFTYEPDLDSLIYLGQKITATPKSGYQFLKWTETLEDDGGDLLIANFTLLSLNICFSQSSHATLYYFSVEESKYVQVEYYEATIPANSIVEIQTTNYSKSGCFKIYEFEFTNSNGNIEKVRYVADNLYYIKGNTLDESNNISITITNETPNKGNIQVVTELKTYSIG